MTKAEKKIHRDYYHSHRAEFAAYLLTDRGQREGARAMRQMFLLFGSLLAVLIPLCFVQW